MAVERSDRPGYLRLETTVPQSGHDGPPEVLFRFQAAVLGMGSITGPDGDDMYFWRAGGAAEAQATIALIWSNLGRVKRDQAAAAMRLVKQQYESGILRPRAPRRRTCRPRHEEHRYLARPAAVTRDLDLAWAAGFLDGEGNFGLPRAGARKHAPDWHRIRVSTSQNGEPGLPPEVLFRMQRLFGGAIEVHGEPDDFRWLIEGVDRVESVLLAVRAWLGTVKQEQARSAIDGFRAQIRVHGDAKHCVRGHPYSRVYMSPAGRRNKCNACDRIRARMQRAARGVAPRQFKNPARRYNF